MKLFIFLFSSYLVANMSLPDDFSLREERFHELSLKIKDQQCQDDSILRVVLDVENDLGELKKIYELIKANPHSNKEMSNIKISDFYTKIDQKIKFLKQKYDECLKRNITVSGNNFSNTSLSYSQINNQQPEPSERIEYVQPSHDSLNTELADIQNRN